MVVSYGNIDPTATGYGNIIVRDLQIVGLPKNQQRGDIGAIDVGNAQNIWVNRVTFTNTNAGGFYAGGSPKIGGHASGIWMTDCIVKGVFGQNCGIVNGYDFHIERNTFIGSSPQPNASHTFIDCEINVSGDQVCFFTICNNVIDARTDFGGTSGITVQGGSDIAVTDIGSGVISGNTCIGGDLAAPTTGGALPKSRMTVGIGLYNASNTTVTGNNLIRCYQAGIFLSSGVKKGSQNNLIASNLIYGSDQQSIEIIGCSNNHIEGNIISGDRSSGYGAAPFIIEKSSLGGNPCSNNTYKENCIHAYGSTPAQLITQGSAILINNYVGGVVASGNAGHGPAYRAANGNTSVGLNDYIVGIDASAGDAKVTLPSAIYPGSPPAPSQGINQAYILKRTDASANTVTIVTFKGQTIDAAAPKTLTALGTPGATLRVISDGANWLSW